MQQTMNFHLIPIDKVGWNKGEIISCIKGQYEIANDSFELNKDSWENGIQDWQAHQLVVTSDEEIKSGDWYIYLEPFQIQKCAVYPIQPDKALKVVAIYPQNKNIPSLTPSDIQYWIDKGCSEKMELVMEQMAYFSKSEIEYRPDDELYQPKIISNCIELVREKERGIIINQQPQPVQEIDWDELRGAFIDRWTTNREGKLIDDVDGILNWFKSKLQSQGFWSDEDIKDAYEAGYVQREKVKDSKPEQFLSDHKQSKLQNNGK